MVGTYTLQAAYNPNLPIFPGPASQMDDVFFQLKAYNKPLTSYIVVTEKGKAISVENARNVIR